MNLRNTDVSIQSLPDATTTALELYTQSYQYDELGNILQMAHAANSGNWNRYYHYTSGFTNNYLLSTSSDNVQPSTDHYSYDVHGNMTKMSHLDAMSWDYADRLQSADLGGGGDVYYTYDAGGNRVRKVIENGNIVEEHIYLGDYEVYRKTVSGTLDTERETLHISDDAGRIALTDTLTVDSGSTVSTPTTTIRYQMSNHLGSATLELDNTAAIISYEEYHPFGSTSYRSGSSSAEVSLKRYRYVGKERDDETGLYYYGARYYAAWLARFVSVDPLKDDYPYYTSYQYAGNKPVTFIDLDGAEESIPPLLFIGTVPGTRAKPSISPSLLRGLGKDPGGITRGYGTAPQVPTGIRYAQDQYGNVTPYYPPIYRINPSVFRPGQQPATQEEYEGTRPTTVGEPGIGTTFYSYKSYLQAFNKNQTGYAIAHSDDPFIEKLRQAGKDSMDRQELERLEQLAKNGETLSDAELSRLTELLGKVKGIYLDRNKISDYFDSFKTVDNSTPEVGGGAKLEFLTLGERFRIQTIADKYGLEITVVGSRASGEAGGSSDWDYIISGGNSKTRSSALYQLPKNPSASKEGDPRPGSEVLKGVEVDRSKPFIKFSPK